MIQVLSFNIQVIGWLDVLNHPAVSSVLSVIFQILSVNLSNLDFILTSIYTHIFQFRLGLGFFNEV